MSAGTDATVEIQKLAHTLGVEPARLAAFAALPAVDLRTLRSQIADALFEADRASFAKVASLSKLIPVAVAARLSEFALPALLAARTAELIEPQRAADLVGRLSDGYLADVSAVLDPARVPEVIAQLPAHRLANVGAELARRREWVVIGGFVAQVHDAALAATVPVFDGEQLLRIGFVLDDKTRLDDVTALASERQLDEILAAAQRHGLWTELDDLLAHLGAAQARRLQARFAVAPAEVLAAGRAAAKDGALSKAGLATLTA